MKKILSFALASLFARNAFCDDTAKVWNTTSGDKATAVIALGYAGLDGKTYVLQKDPAIPGLPVNIVTGTISNGPLQYTRNGSTATVTYDGTTAANNRPLPVELHAGDSTASVATGAGTTSSGTLRVVLPTDQTAIPASQSGAWSMSTTNGATETTLSNINAKFGSQTDSNFGTPSTSSQRIAAMLGVGSTAVSNGNPVPVSQQGTASQNIALVNSGAVETSYGTPSTSSLRVAAMLGVGTAVNSSTNPIFNDHVRINGTTVETNFGTPSLGGQRVAAMLGVGTTAASAGAGATDTGTLRVVANIQRAGNELDYGQGATNTNTQRVAVANEQSPNIGQTPTQITSSTFLPYIQDFSSANLTTTYTQLIASVGQTTSAVEVFNGSGTPIYLAVGAAASEIVQYVIPPGGSSTVIRLRIPVGSRIAIRAHTGTISSGYFIANFFQVT